MKLSFHERGFKSDYILMEKLTYFVLDKFLSSSIIKELKLRIIIKKASSPTFNDYGKCMQYGCLPFRKFDVTILKRKDYLNTLVHELIHVKQMALGEHVPRNEDFKMLWLGNDYTNAKYVHQPWETEAYGYETKLLEEFMQEWKRHGK